MKAMILAAGFGTRMQPLTLTRPKALIAIKGKTLLERNIGYLQSFGVTEITVNVHHFANQIADFIAENKAFGITIHLSDESDAVLETGGGLKRAQRFLEGDSPFFLMNVDILTTLSLEKLLLSHQKNEDALATLAVSDRSSSRVLLLDENQRMKGWRNEKTQEQILHASPETPLIPKAFSGVHILSPRIFDFMTQTGKFSIIDTYLELCQTQAIYGFDHSGDAFLDVGKPEAITTAEALFP